MRRWKERQTNRTQSDTVGQSVLEGVIVQEEFKHQLKKLSRVDGVMHINMSLSRQVLHYPDTEIITSTVYCDDTT